MMNFDFLVVDLSGNSCTISKTFIYDCIYTTRYKIHKSCKIS